MHLKSTTLGGLIGALYFVATTLAATLIGGGETEAMNVIAQILNIHVTLFFAAFNPILPLNVASNLWFQFGVGIVLSYLVGWVIGKVVQMIRHS